MEEPSTHGRAKLNKANKLPQVRIKGGHIAYTWVNTITVEQPDGKTERLATLEDAEGLRRYLPLGDLEQI